MKKVIIQLMFVLLAALLSMQSCKSEDSQTDDSGDDKANSSDDSVSTDDSASDADSDTDTDTDSDGDADSDSNGDTGTGESADSDSNMEASSCPDSLPVDGDACTNMQLSGCEFGDMTCDCAWNGGGGFAWSCRTSCPSTSPANGDSCSDTQYTPCTYEPETCVCATTDDTTWTWKCEEVATECPAAQPETGGLCDATAVGAAAPEGCTYEDINCNCAMWTNSWTCLKQCPASLPTTGDDCAEGQESPCVFDEQACTCGSDDDTTWTWTCEDVATECPAEQPEAAGMCDADAIAEAAPDGCAYGDINCSCTAWTNSWMCREQCPASPPSVGDDCTEDQASPCEYIDDDQLCTCGRDDKKWSCEAAAGSCPETQPEDGDRCQRGAIEAAGNCSYDNIECVCDWFNSFNCTEIADTDETDGEDTATETETGTDNAD